MRRNISTNARSSPWNVIYRGLAGRLGWVFAPLTRRDLVHQLQVLQLLNLLHDDKSASSVALRCSVCPWPDTGGDACGLPCRWVDMRLSLHGE